MKHLEQLTDSEKRNEGKYAILYHQNTMFLANSLSYYLCVAKVMETIERYDRLSSNNKRRKIGENDEINISHKTRPNDLYKSILENIDKYSYLCDEEYAGPITKKEIISRVSIKRANSNSDNG